MLTERPIEIQHLFNGCVKPCEQHVDHHEDFGLAIWIDESAYDLVVVKLTCDFELGTVVGTVVMMG